MTDDIGKSGNTWIYFSGNKYPQYAIGCWCSRWDEDNYNVIFETFLDSSNRDKLFSHVTPNAYREIYNILGTPKFIDTTYNSGNSLRISPIGGTGISGLREERIIAVRNIQDTFINPNYFGIKVEGFRLDIE